MISTLARFANVSHASANRHLRTSQDTRMANTVALIAASRYKRKEMARNHFLDENIHRTEHGSPAVPAITTRLRVLKLINRH